MRTKQVLVMRKFKSLRTGKYCAQAAHASLAAFLECQKISKFDSSVNDILQSWLDNSFRKITLYVETEQELVILQTLCNEANIPSYLIIDNGTTEFGGDATITSLGIGPWIEEEIDKLTKSLKLF